MWSAAGPGEKRLEPGGHHHTHRDSIAAWNRNPEANTWQGASIGEMRPVHGWQGEMGHPLWEVGRILKS